MEERPATFPPVTVFCDGSEFWLADGFHRVEAVKALAWSEIAADVKQGTRRDAVLYSVGANATHGVPRTNADKRRAVLTMLNDPEWVQWSDREIARRCAVNEHLVAEVRDLVTASSRSEDRTYTTKHGTALAISPVRIASGYLSLSDPTVRVVTSNGWK